jgi:hypothetical protein
MLTSGPPKPLILGEEIYLLMFVVIPTYAQVSSIKVVLKLLSILVLILLYLFVHMLV